MIDEKRLFFPRSFSTECLQYVLLNLDDISPINLKTLLIIENDSDTIDVVTIAIEEYSDFKVINSKKILPLQEIADLKPNIILLDNKLEDGNGSELCKRLKKNPITSYIPIIITSAGLYSEELLLECMADAYIQKPFDLNDFLDTINKVAI